MPRKARLNGIKSLKCYTIDEAAEVSGVSSRTIRTWVANGLPAMSEERPTLIRGDALHAYIKGQRQSRKRQIALHEFYCLKCRDARLAAEGMADCEVSGARATLIAICATCETVLRKPFAVAEIPTLSTVLDVSICTLKADP